MGEPLQWSSWQDAVTYHAKGLVSWSIGENKTTYYGGKNKAGTRSYITVPSIIAVKSNNHIKRRIPVLSNRNLFGRDLNFCAYCGKIHLESKLTRDHIVPVSRGGHNTWLNCITACKKCNNEKDNKTLEEWGTQLKFLPYVPDRYEVMLLANRNVLADQMEFLLNHIPKNSRVHKENAFYL